MIVRRANSHDMSNFIRRGSDKQCVVMEQGCPPGDLALKKTSNHSIHWQHTSNHSTKAEDELSYRVQERIKNTAKYACTGTCTLLPGGCSLRQFQAPHSIGRRSLLSSEAQNSRVLSHPAALSRQTPIDYRHACRNTPHGYRRALHRINVDARISTIIYCDERIEIMYL